MGKRRTACATACPDVFRTGHRKLAMHSPVVLFLAVVSVSHFTSGQIVLPGSCPKLPTQPNFNPAQFITGRWYEISRYPSAFEENTRCSLIDIKPSKQGALNMNFKAINSTDGKNTTVTGGAYFDYGELSKFLVKMPIASWNSVVEVRFWIMATDYANYALAWSCDPLCDGFRREQLWLLSRQKTLSSDLWESIKKNNFANGQFKSEYLLPVDQSNCPTITLVKDTLTEEDLFLLKSP